MLHHNLTHAAARQKFSELEVKELWPEDFSRPQLEEFLVGSPLFGKKFLILIHQPTPEMEEALEECRAMMTESANVFIWPTKPKAPANQPQTKFNLFTLADALGRRDRKKLWLGLQAAARVEAEEIFWLLHWKVKTLLLVKTAKNPKKLGLKPFVLERALVEAKNFETTELKNLSARLLEVFYQSRRSQTELPLALERLALEL